MIIVTVHLASARDGKVTELARMHICNEGGDEKVAHYGVSTLRGRDTAALNRGVVTRSGKVRNHRRLDLHVWHLVGKALTAMGYGDRA